MANPATKGFSLLSGLGLSVTNTTDHMPLHQIIEPDAQTQIYLWKITEPLSQLRAEVPLKDKSVQRLQGMKSEQHQRGFLSVRKLLQAAGYTDFDLHYDAFGKPYLKNGRHISISHSHAFSSIVITDRDVGIDLEMQREKITLIGFKFAEKEIRFLNPESADYIRKLTVIWGAKEAIFKIRNEVGISFNNHIEVAAFNIGSQRTAAVLNFQNTETHYNIFFEEVENFTLVYAFEK